MERFPTTMANRFDDVISENHCQRVSEESAGSGIEEDDEDDDMYGYDDPPPYDISAKLVEINAELANVRLPQDTYEERPRRVTFLDNPVQSEIPPTPTDSTDEDDGYGDSTEASDDTDGYGVHHSHHGSTNHHSIEPQNGRLQFEADGGHYGPNNYQANEPQNGRHQFEAKGGHLAEDLPPTPNYSPGKPILEPDDVEQLLRHVKLKKNVRNETDSVDSTPNSLPDELNQFLKSFTEMAIKNNAGVADSAGGGRPVLPGIARRSSADFDQLASEFGRRSTNSEALKTTGNRESTILESSCKSALKRDDEGKVEVRGRSEIEVLPDDRTLNQDLIDEESQTEANLEKHENLSSISLKEDKNEVEQFKANADNESDDDDISEPNTNFLDNKLLKLSSMSQHSSKPKSTCKNSTSNFTRWKRAFHLINRKKTTTDRWNATLHKMAAACNGQYVGQTEGDIQLGIQEHTTDDSSDDSKNSPPTRCRTPKQPEVIKSSSPSNKVVPKTKTIRKPLAVANPDAILTPPGKTLPLQSPLPSISAQPSLAEAIPSLSMESEAMIMTSRDGHFCLMTTEDFQSADNANSRNSGPSKMATVELAAKGTSTQRPTSRVQRSLKSNKVMPGDTNSSAITYPPLKKSNSTLGSGSSCGRWTNEPYSRGTFPTRACPGGRAQSARPMTNRDRGPTQSRAKMNNFLPVASVKEMYPPHGYGLSSEQKQERERKLKKIELNRQLKKQAELDEESKRKQEGEEAFQAWLRKKMSTKLSSNNERAPQDGHDGHTKPSTFNAESGLAFREWLKRKKAQKLDEQRTEEFKQMVEEKMHYIRTREQNEKAFRKWLRRKKARNGTITGIF